MSVKQQQSREAALEAKGVSTPLYASRAKIYPQSVRGKFRNIKWLLLAVTLGIYYLLPFVRWDRGPFAPNQAVLVDLENRRFYFFFIEIWPQEVYYLTGLLILAAMSLFLMNALAGRIWCGYLCPQTIWTDLFLAVERLIEGDRRERFYASIGYSLLFDLEDHYVDGLIGGNDAIYINHSKKKPNLEAIIYRGSVWFQALRAIKKGEELTFDYGFDPVKPKKK